jgi:hypothetical protein
MERRFDSGGLRARVVDSGGGVDDLSMAADLSLLKVEEEIQKAEQALRLDMERFGPRNDEEPDQGQPGDQQHQHQHQHQHQYQHQHQHRHQPEQEHRRGAGGAMPPSHYGTSAVVPPGARMSVS